MKTTAPFGSWQSPITADLIVSKTIGFSSVISDGDDVYWIETRPQESGRHVVVKRSLDGTVSDITPKEFSARTRVHEYGGGAACVHEGTLYFANYADQRIYKQERGALPKPVTAGEPGHRFADFVVDPERNRLISVLEDHSNADQEPANSIVAIDLDQLGKITTLVSGADFYSSPKLSPDRNRLAWLSWNHPDMPWDGTELYAGTFGKKGELSDYELIAGGTEESIFQPEWSPENKLYFVSDRTDWWNLYRVNITDSALVGALHACPDDESINPNSEDRRNALHAPARYEIESLCDMSGEFGRPQWIFGESTYAFRSAKSLVCTFNRDGIWHLAELDLKESKKGFRQIATDYTEIAWLRATKNRAIFCGASPTQMLAIVALDLENSNVEILKASTDISIDSEMISLPEVIEFPTTSGLISYAFFYPPQNAKFHGTMGERPPLLVKSHGGPIASTSTMLNLKIQYWTSRGFAVVDVNYGGSTGYGRKYRKRLYGNWGIVDVDDCVNAASHLAKKRLVDAKRLLISGGSAGGYTTLCALTFKNVFAAGASYYGIADLSALCDDTHKFESRTADRLVAPYPKEKATYIARSPLYHVESLKCPVIFFQGLEDKVVPANQAELMVNALRKQNLPVCYLTFAGEQHGFRKAETIKRCLESELYFYSRILGFELAESLEPIHIENLR